MELFGRPKPKHHHQLRIRHGTRYTQDEYTKSVGKETEAAGGHQRSTVNREIPVGIVWQRVEAAYVRYQVIPSFDCVVVVFSCAGVRETVYLYEYEDDDGWRTHTRTQRRALMMIERANKKKEEER
ncbi:hypothetical protein U1Q18_046052, partial [Sarracenia purpurea var. burkii]